MQQMPTPHESHPISSHKARKIFADKRSKISLCLGIFWESLEFTGHKGK